MKKLGFVVAVTALTACGGTPRAGGGAAYPDERLPDVRVAKGRPPVVIVAREGDPAGAIAVVASTAGMPGFDARGAEPSVALAGVVEARLRARGTTARVVPQWDGFRVVLLVNDVDDARAKARALREALVARIGERDRAAAATKLRALANRPLPDASLERWARCVSSPYARVDRAGKSGDVSIAELESMRAESVGLGRVVFGVAGPPDVGEAVFRAVADDPAWSEASAFAPPSRAPEATPVETFVYDRGARAASGRVVVHGTIDRATGSAAVAVAEALGDPRSPLSARLAALETPFRLREITGTVQRTGGCIGFVLESEAAVATEKELARRVADAVALVHEEAETRRSPSGDRDGRRLAWRAGDPRDAAERAAWWTLAMHDERECATDDAPDAAQPAPVRGSVALGVPAPPTESRTPRVETATDLARALAEQAASWKKPVVDGRTRVEPGQGETWVLVGSPCGTAAETEADAGLTALFVLAAAELVKTSVDVGVEPWITSDGAGLLVHGPARAGESPRATARRLADLAAEGFAAAPLDTRALVRARAEAIARTGRAANATATLAGVLAPAHPSWFLPSGRADVLARAADATVVAHARALRRGPLRVAVLANVDAEQAAAAVRAADRWVDRRATGARACLPVAATTPPKPGTYAAETTPGEPTEALLAFPFPAGDDGARKGAEVVAAALDGEGGLLAPSLAGLATSASARVLGGPRTPALVVRVVATESSLDAAVSQARALLDRLRQGTREGAFDAARARRVTAAVEASLDPRARVVALFRGESVVDAKSAAAAVGTPDDARAFARRYLNEASMVVVAARPPRSRP